MPVRDIYINIAPTMLNKIKGLLKELGALNAALYALHIALSKATAGGARIERFLLVAQPVSPGPRLAPSRSKGTEIRRVEPGDALLSQFPRPEAVIADRYRQGAICLAVVKGEQVQGYLWLIQKGYDEDVARVRFVLPASGRAAWDFDVYVAPEFRLGFTFVKLWDAADAYLRERGIRWSMSRISLFNAGSLASHGRLGAAPIGTATFIILGPAQIMAVPRWPFISLSWGNTRPALNLLEPS